jgi:hypothetical protein
MPGNFAPFEAKMRADGLSDAAVAAFKNAYDALTSGTRQRCSHSEGAFLLDEIRAADITGRKSLAGRHTRRAALPLRRELDR